MSIGIGKNMSFDVSTARGILMYYCSPERERIATAEEMLGYNAAKIFGYRSWFSAMGLLEGDGAVRATPLAHVIQQHDPDMERFTTRLLLYYGISSNPKAEVWYQVINHYFYEAFLGSKDVSSAEGKTWVRQAGTGASSTAQKQRDKDVALCVRTLTSPRAFGPLGVLTPKGHGRFQVSSCRVPPLFCVYVIYNRWENDVPYIHIRDLHMPGHIGRTLFLRPSLVGEYLQQLEQRGLVRVHRSASLNQIMRTGNKRPLEILEELYGYDERP